MLDHAVIEMVLDKAPRLRIGVLGDLFLDRYLDLDASLTEPSLETGLDAFQVVNVRSQPGAAGTVINNLAALGVGQIVPVAAIGDDGEGYELRQALGAMPAVELTHVATSPTRRTPTYTKPILSVGDGSARELNRLDIKNRTPTPPAIEQAILRALNEIWDRIDALIVLDQVSEENCGVVTARVHDRLAKLADADPGKFVLADSRNHIHCFRSVSIKPNQGECKDISALRRNCARAMFVTRGADGTRLFPAGGGAHRDIPAFPVAGPIDPVGAGDSVSAGIATGVAAGLSLEDAAAFGNLVASITVQQLGTTGTASPEQVRARWRELGYG